MIVALRAAHPRLECEEKVITTQGDKILDKPLPEIGGGNTLRAQFRFEEYLSKRIANASYTFRKHLQPIGGAIEE